MNDYNHIKASLIRLFHEGDKTINEFLHDLNCNYGYDRAKIYHLVRDVMNCENIPDEISDVLADILTAITGDCSPACIIRFNNEPQDIDELTAYVRSNKWK